MPATMGMEKPMETGEHMHLKASYGSGNGYGYWGWFVGAFLVALVVLVLFRPSCVLNVPKNHRKGRGSRSGRKHRGRGLCLNWGTVLLYSLLFALLVLVVVWAFGAGSRAMHAHSC